MPTDCRCLLMMLIACAMPVRAADPPGAAGGEADALSLADQAATAPDKPVGPWRVFLEGAGTQRRLSDPSDRASAARVSVDLRFDAALTPGLRLVVSNRLDWVRDQADRPVESVNTLREAFLSWAASDTRTVDLGRLNVRHGVALGYNPTDWFKEGALRGVVSPDPSAIRENRQGTVVLRGQQLWPEGGVSFTLSPRLERSRAGAADALSLDLSATNARHRWLLAGSWRLGAGWTPEVLLHGGEGTAPQLGLNLSALAGDAVVVFGEAATGRGLPLAAQALLAPAEEPRQRRAALGMTYTTPFNLTLTVEAEYNSAAPDRARWRALQAGNPAAALRLIGTASGLQDLPARRAVFAYATWKDAFVRRLDVSAFMRQELETHSRSQWIEVRHRWDEVDLSLQLLLNAGNEGSVYRAVPLRHALELALRWYL